LKNIKWPTDKSAIIPALNLSECNVFFDFDNTIVPFDVLDDIIKRFSNNGDWVVLEKAWRAGEIGSKECLEGQLRSIRITRDTLMQYLSKIKIDNYFPKLLTMLREKGTKPIVLSDSFSFIIENILRNNGIEGLKVYSNKMRFHKDRIVPLFPYTNKFCSGCANCKTKRLPSNGSRNKIVVYVGDGLSDICPAQNADFVFAKGNLLEYFTNAAKPCVPFEDLGDIYKYLTG